MILWWILVVVPLVGPAREVERWSDRAPCALAVLDRRSLSEIPRGAQAVCVSVVEGE